MCGKWNESADKSVTKATTEMLEKKNIFTNFKKMEPPRNEIYKIIEYKRPLTQKKVVIQDRTPDLKQIADAKSCKRRARCFHK